MTRLGVLVLSACLAVAGGVIAAADVRVRPLVREGRVWISFGLADGFTAEVRDAILSGLAITFTYDIELRRSVPFWPDRTLTTASIAVRDRYDSLTRCHELARTFDGRIEANKVTEDEAEARRWLTSVELVPLFATSNLEANTEYYVRVRARTQPNNSLFRWPWERGLATAHANFTFIP
jgi:uncharacterized protein DUF4390